MASAILEANEPRCRLICQGARPSGELSRPPGTSVGVVATLKRGRILVRRAPREDPLPPFARPCCHGRCPSAPKSGRCRMAHRWSSASRGATSRATGCRTLAHLAPGGSWTGHRHQAEGFTLHNRHAAVEFKQPCRGCCGLSAARRAGSPSGLTSFTYLEWPEGHR